MNRLTLDSCTPGPMTPVAGIHGILNYRYYRKTANLAEATKKIGADWAGWLRPGLARVDLSLPGPAEIPVAYYSDCLKLKVQQGGDDPEFLDPLTRADFVDYVEQIRRARAGGPAPIALGRTGRPARQASQWLTENCGPAARTVVTRLCRELRVYFAPAHADRREQARSRLAEVIRTHRPRVLLAHSLGSVVAYETLCADPALTVELLVTLGSPLGVRDLVFERLEPTPFGRGIRPPGARRWVNIADPGDPVAVPARKLGKLFDGVNDDQETPIHLVKAHKAENYLRCDLVSQTVAPYFVL